MEIYTHFENDYFCSNKNNEFIIFIANVQNFIDFFFSVWKINANIIVMIENSAKHCIE